MANSRDRNDMKEPLTVSALARGVWQDFRLSWGALVVFEMLFKLFQVWLFAPALALVLSALLHQAGHVAVSNRDILSFLLTPTGLAYAALVGTAAVAMLLIEQAGIMLLVALARSGQRPPLISLLITALRQTLRVIQLSAIQLVLLAVILLPFLLLAVLTYRQLLTQHDIYFYWKERPPVFWLAASIGGLLLLAAAAVGIGLCVRWALALPIVLFERTFVPAALRASRQRVRGRSWRIGLILLGWLLGMLLLGMLGQAGFRLLAATVLDNAGEQPISRTLLLLIAQAGLLAAMSFVTVVGMSLLIRRLYLFRSEQLGLRSADGIDPAAYQVLPTSPWTRRLALVFIALVCLAPLALWARLPRQLEQQPLVMVTAHRGHARAAPENTLASIRKAIESGADYAEIDVHQTADGVVVLLHDRDLKRVAGISQRLEDMTYDEVRKLDVGSWFDPAFASERIPTLLEVIELCRGRIRLNIELKLFGPHQPLVADVARILREEDFEAECLITAFSYEALQEAKQLNPRLRTGLTIAAARGDISRLEVDALSIRANSLSDEVLRAAHRQGMEVHVWTVNDATQMLQFMYRGVDNIITSDPDLAIRVRNEWASAIGMDRLLLASRLLLGLHP